LKEVILKIPKNTYTVKDPNKKRRKFKGRVMGVKKNEWKVKGLSKC